jgi:hypothetical protein
MIAPSGGAIIRTIQAYTLVNDVGHGSRRPGHHFMGLRSLR